MPHRVPTLIGLVLVLGLMGLTLSGGHVGSLRIGLAGLLGLLALYLAESLRRPRWLAVNTLVLVNLSILAVGLEVLLRLLAGGLPLGLVELLPSAARQDILARRGLFTESSLRGSGLLYSWKTDHAMPQFPWLRVDHAGYRNPEPWPARVDAVLLGDSVTIAQNIAEDQADGLRRSGLAALNLAFSGYGTFHQRDAYRWLVVEPGLAHGAVVVNFCHCNDLTDNLSYQGLESAGRDWRDYLGKTPSRNAFPFAFDPPWVVSLAFNAPFVLAQEFYNRRAGGEARQPVDTPAGRLMIRRALLAPQPDSEASWAATDQAMADIAALARRSNARLVIGYYPNTRHIHAAFLEPGPAVAIEAERAQALERLGRMAQAAGGQVVDYTPALRRAIQAGRRISETDDDYHPNADGVAAMVETLLPLLR